MPSGICTQGCRRDSYTYTVGGGNDGSANAPTGTAMKTGRRLERVEDRRAALGAEGEAALFAVLVGVADVLPVLTFDPDALGGEARLRPEHAPGPPLACEAVAEGDAHRFALDGRA